MAFGCNKTVCRLSDKRGFSIVLKKIVNAQNLLNAGFLFDVFWFCFLPILVLLFVLLKILFFYLASFKHQSHIVSHDYCGNKKDISFYILFDFFPKRILWYILKILCGHLLQFLLQLFLISLATKVLNLNINHRVRWWRSTSQKRYNLYNYFEFYCVSCVMVFYYSFRWLVMRWFCFHLQCCRVYLERNLWN